MAKSKTFYWLKLKRDFFKRHDIQIIESMPNGKDYRSSSKVRFRRRLYFVLFEIAMREC